MILRAAFKKWFNSYGLWFKKPKKKPKANAVFLVVFPIEQPDLTARVELGFIFSAHPKLMEFKTVTAPLSMADLLQIAPSKILFIGEQPSKLLRKEIKSMGAEYRFMSAVDAPATHTQMPAFSRGKIADVVGKRMAIYVHKPHQRNLPIILAAYLDARRQYPDLLLMMTGMEREAVERHQDKLNFISETDGKTRRQAGDVILNSSPFVLKEWLEVANVFVLLSENEVLEEITEMAVSAGTAILAYQVDSENVKGLRALEAAGAIWSAQRPGSLLAAMAQALSPEKSALTVVQSQERLMAGRDALIENIDALLKSA